MAEKICHHGFEDKLNCGYCQFEDIRDCQILVDVNDEKSKMKIIWNVSQSDEN